MKPDDHFSPHFTYREMTTSQLAERKGVTNSPSASALKNLEALCNNLLEPARLGVGGIRISSGFRCAELNNLVGGALNSKHLVGLAADVVPIKCSTLDLAKFVVKHLAFDQVILEYGTMDNPAWIHLGWSLSKPRREVWRKLLGLPYEKITL